MPFAPTVPSCARRAACALLLGIPLLAAPGRALPAQHGGAARALSTAPKEVEQFAFLVGQWEVVVRPKVNTLAARIHGGPKLLGSWKAWRALDGFAIEDELRIVDASGNPNALSHSVRTFDVASGRWTQSTLDAYRARFTTATGTFVDGVLTLRSVGRDAEGRPYVQRARFYDVTPTSFKYVADRSTDGERSWDEGVLRMDATRVATSAPR